MAAGRRALLPLLLALAAAGAARGAAASSLIRGVRPEQVEKYQPVDGRFACFDGSRSIDFGAVNDNFCDCPDGSDEPGTSACPGVFYCRNRGHEPKLLSSSFVDDGVCDCCDGSDELSGCKNTCIEKNSATRDALRARIGEYKASLEKKAAYAASAAGVRENIKQRHANVDGDIARAEAELEKLTADKKRVEEETEVKRAAHKKEQDALAAQRKAEREAAAAKAAEEAAAKAAADAAAAEQAAAADAAAAAAAAAGQDGAEATQAEAVAAEQAAAGEQEETDEERGRRIAAQWTNDPAAAGPAGSESADGAGDAAAGEPAADVKADSGWSLSGVLSKAKETVAKIITPTGTAPPPEGEEGDGPLPEDDEPPTPYDGEDEAPPEEEDPSWHAPAGAAHDPEYVPFDESELRKVRSDHAAAERKLSELRAEKERVGRQVGVTFNDAWAGLMNKCLEARMPQFTYKFCFFDKAVQVDNGGGHETSLGVWKGFEKGGSEALFDGGDYCHKAPARSLRVRIECGPAERAWEASEPEVCTYVVHAATPAACKKEKLEELEASMAALLAEEAALAAEIAAEEAQRQQDLAGLRAKIQGDGGHDEL
ncbi:glucosidase 2 subunit beta [Scenedesmus sp. PABB004]|nr:glucosidase 2 subunit beta [Scenedesmus sp. PABB004]